MSKTLTVSAIEKLKPGTARREVPDGGCPGLFLIIQPTGAKSWSLRFRSPIERGEDGQRKAKKLTLGPVTLSASTETPKIGQPLTLPQARALATAGLTEVAHGRDPTHARREERAKERERSIEANTLDAAFVEFLNRYRGRKRQGLRESTRLLTASYLGLKPDPDKAGEWVKTGRGVLKRWSGRPLTAITKLDVMQLVEALADAGHGVTANRTLTVLKTFYTWAVKRDMLAASPAAVVDAPANEESRERRLTDAELIALWKVSGSYGYPYGDLVRLLILTGARRDELREAPWTEFQLEKAGYVAEADYTLDAGLWRLPPERSKNGHSNMVPLVPLAIDILKGLKRIRGIRSRPKLLFSTNGETVFSALSGAKKRLDALFLAELRKTNPKAKLERWTLHDLRRTFASGLQRLGFSSEVIEACTNHRSGTRSGVAGVYQRDPMLRQKHEAFEAWARHIERLVSGKEAAKVVELARARVSA